jgi:pyrroline-5-carboxylate reductase
MAGAMLGRWLAAGLDPARARVVRPSGRPVAQGVRVESVLGAAPPPGALCLLGFKPQQLGTIAPAIAPHLVDVPLVSILAGATTARLRDHFPGAGPILRCMPNLPVAIGEGVCALYAAHDAGEPARNAVAALMRPLGLVEWLDDEAQFDLVTALSGSGPAFAYRFIDALASAAARLGLEPDQARRLALATVNGAAQLAARDTRPPAALAEAVASPGGMTRRGLDVLDADDRLVTLLADMLRATRDRGRALNS